jgi:hypothetical protein
MSRSVRVFARQRQGRIPMNVNLPAFEVTRRSAISITVGQVSLGSGLFDPDVRPTVHGPDVFVTNVCPHGDEGGGGGVEFMLHVNSDSPIDVAITITVFEPFEDHVLL